MKIFVSRIFKSPDAATLKMTTINSNAVSVHEKQWCLQRKVCIII